MAFFTIVWFAGGAFYLNNLLRARPLPNAPAWILFAFIAAAYAYPIAIGWLTLSFDGIGVLAYMAGTIAMLALAVAYRRIVFPSLFGVERRSLVGEFKAVRAAQRAVREDTASTIDSFKHD